MSTRRPSGRPGRNRAAERRGILAMAYSRAVAEAEVHRDRARAGLNTARAAIDRDRAAGLDVVEAERMYAGLVTGLAEREADIVRARIAGGLDDRH